MAFGTAPRANGAGYVHLMVRWLPWLDPDTDEPCFAELLSLQRLETKRSQCIASSHMVERKEPRERTPSVGLSGIRIPSPLIHPCGGSAEISS